MMPCWQNRSPRLLPNAPLPDAARRIIHAMACSVALCSQPSDQASREVVVTIRRRPLDRGGRSGCRAEIWTDGPPPPTGLKAIRAASGGLFWPSVVPRRADRISALPAALSCTLGLHEAVLSGWKVTLDLRWTCTGQNEGWSI